MRRKNPNYGRNAVRFSELNKAWDENLRTEPKSWQNEADQVKEMMVAGYWEEVLLYLEDMPSMLAAFFQSKGDLVLLPDFTPPQQLAFARAIVTHEPNIKAFNEGGDFNSWFIEAFSTMDTDPNVPRRQKLTRKEQNALVRLNLETVPITTEAGIWFEVCKYELTQLVAQLLTRGKWDGRKGSYVFDDPDEPLGFMLPMKVPNIIWAGYMANRASELFGYTPCYEIADYKGVEAAWKRPITLNPEANGFRLPHPKEWKAAFGNGGVDLGDEFAAEAVAWFENNAVSIQVIGQLEPNEYGLHDMSGNVWEWCEPGVWADVDDVIYDIVSSHWRYPAMGGGVNSDWETLRRAATKGGAFSAVAGEHHQSDYPPLGVRFVRGPLDERLYADHPSDNHFG